MVDVLATLKKLPAMCAAHHRVDDAPVVIRCGVIGCFPAPGLDVDDFNNTRGITPAQVLAMEIGSMFGWDVPGADPDYWQVRAGEQT